MKCMCCGKELPIIDIEPYWHKKCIRRFFGTELLPELDITREALVLLATESTNRGYTVPGIQKKMSLHLSTLRSGTPKLTLVNYPTGYILKPQTEQYAFLPEAEFLVMQMAVVTGIETVPFALIPIISDGSELAYITRRIDRVLPSGKEKKVQLLAMEDFCQLDYRLTEDKYRGSYERCARIIEKHSSQRWLDISELFLRLVFSFVTGNSDMHLKNFSLIEASAGSQTYVLSAAYDLLPVNVIMPEDTEQMALTLNGKKRNIHRNDFLKFADTIGMQKSAAEKIIDKVISMRDVYLTQCADSYLPESMKENMSVLIESRITALKKHSESQTIL